MHRINLSFSNSTLESEYQAVNKSFVIKKLYLSFKLILTVSLLMMITYILKQALTIRNVIILISIVIFILLHFLMKKWLPKVFEITLKVICSLMSVMFVELIKEKLLEKQFNVQNCLILMIPFGLYVNIFLLSRINWIFCSLVYLFNLVYLCVRIFDLEFFLNSSNKEEIIVGITLIMINIVIISYNEEKTNREYFKNLRDSNDNLKQFKELLQSILPSSIFIVNYEKKKLEFSNKSAQKLVKKLIKLSDELGDEKIGFTSSSKLNINRKIKMVNYDNSSIEYFEEIMDSFHVLEENNQSLIGLLDSQPSVSELMRKYYKSKFISRENLSNSISNDFTTLHVFHKSFKKSGDSPEVSIMEDEFNEVSFSKKFYFEVKLARILWDSKPCLFVVFNDNTNSKRLIELINLDRYKNQMLATVSHDLRTPLNGVIGMISTVLSNLQDREMKKNLIVAIRSANLLNFLINDILDFSQISYKKLRLNVEKINLGELVSEIFNLMKMQAKKKQLDFRLEMNFNENDRVYSDSNRLKQILLNLIGNAIKFTNKGFIILKVEKIEESETRMFKFSVQDSGIGIKEEDLSKLFVLFGKLKQENPELNRTGIGFGLTISNTLAKMLYLGPESGIFVKSEYGLGSTFWFKIDGGSQDLENFSFIEEKNQNELQEGIITKTNRYDSSVSIEKHVFWEQQVGGSILQSHPDNKNKKILIVDDDPINIMILEKYMQFFQLEYLTAMNGIEAIEVVEREILCNNNEILAILMDCNMPVMDGFKAAENIIELLKNNKKAEIPIIAVTANATNSDLDLCLKSGMKKFISKPVRRRDLGLILQSMFKIKIPE